MNLKAGANNSCFIYHIHYRRWGELLRFPGYRIFSTGVLNLKMIRAHQRRCMAIGLPFVLNGLLEDNNFVLTAIEYCHWRALLQCTNFRGGRPCAGDSTQGIGSLSDLTAAGARLQRMMLSLKQTVEDSDDAVFSCIQIRMNVMHLLNFCCSKPKVPQDCPLACCNCLVWLRVKLQRRDLRISPPLVRKALAWKAPTLQCKRGSSAHHA